MASLRSRILTVETSILRRAAGDLKNVDGLLSADSTGALENVRARAHSGEHMSSDLRAMIAMRARCGSRFVGLCRAKVCGPRQKRCHFVGFDIPCRSLKSLK